MAVFRLTSDKVKGTLFCSSALFLAAVILYFSEAGPACRMAFPLTILTIASLWLTPWQMTLAMLFSASGDWLGTQGLLLGQMASFAIAHVWLAAFFFQRYSGKVETDGKLTSKAKGYMFMIVLLTLVLLAFVLVRIVPEAPAGIIRIGTGVYSCLICLMLVGALLQRSSLYASGAILFVFSDFILAWNMFVENIPHAGFLIMIPYYIGQWLLFARSTPYRIHGLRRHRL